MARGISLVALTVMLSGGAALVADLAFDLPALARQVLLISWIGLGLLSTLAFLVIPLSRKIQPAALAAVVEEEYPEFDERLTTSVELSEGGQMHGAAALIELLYSDTEKQAKPLNFERAFPARMARRFAIAAGCLFLVLALPAALWPSRAAELGERFLFPTRTYTAFSPYIFEIGPGDKVAGRGRPVQFTVIVRVHEEETPLPTKASLVFTNENGQVERVRLTADGPDRFSYELEKLPGSLDYYVEADSSASSSFRITAVEPVEVAEGTSVKVTPPQYAQKAIDTQELPNLPDLAALQHGDVGFEVRFNRPAVNAVLEWTPKAVASTKGPNSSAKVEAPKPVLHPLSLSEDRKTGRFTLKAREEGSYRFILSAEHDIRTEIPARTVTVKIDQPPAFTNKVFGGEGVKAAHPLDILKFELALADDVGVDLAELEYRVNDGPVLRESLNLKGLGSRDAYGQHDFHLSGRVKNGDTLQYRFKAADNRRVPEASLEPHVIFHPTEQKPGQPRWFSLKIDQGADSPREQSILARRDNINRSLEAIIKKLQAERTEVRSLRKDSERQDALTPNQTKNLEGIRRENRDAQVDLNDLARELAQANELMPLAEKVRDVAQQELKQSDQQLQQAGNAKQPDPRNQNLQKTEDTVAEAIKRLEDLKRVNDQIAKEQYQQQRLEALAQRQEELARRAAEQAAKDPVRDPEAQKMAEELARQQEQLARELEKQTRESEPLKQALDVARADLAKDLAEQAKQLAQEQRDLNQAREDTELARRQEALAELAKKQQELAKKAQELAKDTQLPAQAAARKPLDTEPPQKAADLLKEGDPQKAIQEQSKAAKELDKLGSDLDKALDLAKDPREAAKQLARLQEGLQNRMEEELKKKDDPTPLEKRLAPLAEEQKAIQQAAAQLSTPPKNEAAQREQQKATEAAQKAAQALDKQEPNAAKPKMEEAKRALEQLANNLPSLKQREEQARREVAELRRKQEEIGREVERAARDFEKADPNAAKTRDELAKRLADTARKQAEVAEQLAKVDAPNQEARQERALREQNKALADLMDARPQDVNASQQAARRELERLAQALNGQQPADEKAAELAKAQQELAQAMKNPNATPEEQKQQARKQAEIAAEARRLNAPEAPLQQAKAEEATKQASKAVAQKSPEAAKLAEQAAKDLQELARQMQGRESPAEQAERLAREQSQQAAETARGKSNSPSSAEKEEQKKVAQEAQQVRGGEQAQAEKQKALEALAKAQEAGNRQQTAEAQQKAADALRDLADKLAGRQTPAEKAAEIARQQRQIAD
ncbi:MAG: hypothetical protein AB7K24_08625, partial [Gemmataceae bacterium]